MFSNAKPAEAENNKQKKARSNEHLYLYLYCMNVWHALLKGIGCFKKMANPALMMMLLLLLLQPAIYPFSTYALIVFPRRKKTKKRQQRQQREKNCNKMQNTQTKYSSGQAQSTQTFI